MFKTEKEKKDFCKKYNISEDRFRESLVSWDGLSLIAEDYNSKRNEHMDTVRKYADNIQRCQYVHSLSYRVKDVEHLIEKIIRKNPKFLEKGDSISLSNYEKIITDMMGIRVLILFKEDWRYVHDFIMKEYGNSLLENPFVHVRKGDDCSLYEGVINIIDDKPYRSAHYVIKSENGLGVEIQVRTLYEEAWSEIDHKIRYPYNISDEVITRYIDIMNRITGVGDEMGSFINDYWKTFQSRMTNGIIDDNEVYDFILSEIDKIEEENIKNSIRDKIMQAENYQERRKLSDLAEIIISDL